MRDFGYDVEDCFEDGYLPRFVDEFRRRPLCAESWSDSQGNVVSLRS
jgi:hypothetical protein